MKTSDHWLVFDAFSSLGEQTGMKATMDLILAEAKTPGQIGMFSGVVTSVSPISDHISPIQLACKPSNLILEESLN